MIKKLSLYTIALLGCLVLFNSCKKDYETIEAFDERQIAEYLAKNNIKDVNDTLGYYYQILDEGTGGTVDRTDSVFYTYDFKHASGASFFKNSDYQIPRNFLGYTDRFGFKDILAVRLTLAKLQKGGTARVILPSRLAFGKNGNKTLGVESNEIVVIDLALLTQKNWVEMDNYLLDKFVAAKGINPVIDPSRVRYIISAEGTGKEDVKSTSKVKVKYTGRLLDGTVFDSSTDGVEFLLDGVIKGWTEVLPGKIGVGGKIRLLIPSDLGYGQTAQRDGNGNVSIPANAILDFDIEIVSVTN
ncbi:FKBP-type peptidyl-prolyl cis-trans isomerase [Pedobacter sp. ASV1-7]|uniref:FKBP-type peptidyl-prolyl cis-trans isomerase n=1 Tax=Pedobacter sp. ASV1-7 TaxID=3145237 RepID=UPI0032E8F9D3